MRYAAAIKNHFFFEEMISEAENKAIDFLKSNEPEEGYCLCFSGGKDSCVIKHLAKKASIKFQSHYSATRIDPPEVVKFVKQHHKDVIFNFPKRSFFSYLVQYGYPAVKSRWCCSSLKKAPTRITKVPLAHRILGVRAEESVNRAKFKDMISSGGNSPYVKGQTVYKPIFHWPEWMIWEYIAKENIPYCNLYDEGFDRIGCMVCPMICSHDRKKIDLHKQRWPGFFKAFEAAMKRLYDTHDKLEGVRLMFSFDEFLDRWYRSMPILGAVK